MLAAAVAACGAAVLEVRLVNDRYTGAPRGLAFVELATVLDGVRALNACNGMVFEGQPAPLRIVYAKDRGGAAQGVLDSKRTA